MGISRLLVALIAFTGLLAAADPCAGTWKLQVAKSWYRIGTPPKEETVSIVEKGQDLEISVQEISAQGVSAISRFIVPASGGSGKILQSPFDGVSVKFIGPYRQEFTYFKSGQAVLTWRSQVSLNRQTMTVILNGTDMLGKPIDAIAVYFKRYPRPA